MCDDVALSQRSAPRAELCLQILEESKIDVDQAILGAVERADLRGGDSAACRDLVGIEHGLGRLVLLARLLEFVRPELLNAVDVADDSTVLAPVGVGARTAFLEPTRAGLRDDVRVLECPQARGIATHEQVDGQDEERAQAPSASNEESSASHSASANIVNLAPIERCVGVEGHGEAAYRDIRHDSPCVLK